jgi:hypothetical protein
VLVHESEHACLAHAEHKGLAVVRAVSADRVGPRGAVRASVASAVVAATAQATGSERQEGARKALGWGLDGIRSAPLAGVGSGAQPARMRAARA